jgi:hypothetical protein
MISIINEINGKVTYDSMEYKHLCNDKLVQEIQWQITIIRTFLSVDEETAYFSACYFRQRFNSNKCNKDNRHATLFIIS